MTASTIGLHEAVDIVGRNQPAGIGVVDDLRWAAAVDRDHRQLAGHRLDQHLAELLVDRGVNEKVAGAQEVRQIVVRVPAGEEDVRTAEALGIEIEGRGGALQALLVADDDPLTSRRPVADRSQPANRVCP